MSLQAITRENERSAPALVRDGVVVVLSSFFISLLGQVSILLPFTPVPIATQCPAVLLLGLLLGSRRAAAAVLLFLAQGAMGLPVFAAGNTGWTTLIGPRGGYLFGYLVGAFVVGAIMERWKEKTDLKAFFALLAGNGIVYLFGASYLASFIGVQKALLLGIAPFVIFDLIKVIGCVKVLQWLGWKNQ